MQSDFVHDNSRSLGLPSRAAGDLWLSRIRGDGPEIDHAATSPDGWESYRWVSPESGVCITTHVNPALGLDEGLEATVHFLGQSSADPVLLTHFEADDSSPLCAVSILDVEDEVVAYTYVDLEQGHSVRSTPRFTRMEGRITAVAGRISLFSDEAAFATGNAFFEHRPPHEEPFPASMHRSARSIIPFGMEDDYPNIMASVCGVVIEARTLPGARGGAPFCLALVESAGRVPIHMCWPAEHAPLPEPGNVVLGTVMLAASVPGLWEEPPAWEALGEVLLEVVGTDEAARSAESAGAGDGVQSILSDVRPTDIPGVVTLTVIAPPGNEATRVDFCAVMAQAEGSRAAGHVIAVPGSGFGVRHSDLARDGESP